MKTEPVRKKRKVHEKTRKSREAILKAVQTLLQEKAYDDLSVRAICQKAGLSVGAFYHHFSGKDDALNQAILRFNEFLPIKEQEHSEIQDPLLALKEILLAQASYVESVGCELMMEYYRTLFTRRGPAVGDKEQELSKRLTELLERAQEEQRVRVDRSSGEMAEYLLTYGRGLCMDWCMQAGAFGLKERMALDFQFLQGAFLQGTTLGENELKKQEN